MYFNFANALAIHKEVCYYYNEVMTKWIICKP